MVVETAQYDWVAQHQRMCSRSTTASCSPSTSDLLQLPAKKGPTLRKQSRGTTRLVSPKQAAKISQKRRLNFGAQAVNVSTAKQSLPQKTLPAKAFRTLPLSKTPGFSSRIVIRRAELLTSPGGTDYIVTPGRHKIVMTDFLANFDSEAARTGCPGLRAVSNYSESMLHEWLLRERVISKDVYMLSFREDSAMEQFRQMALQSVYNYAVEYKLHEKTVHLTCLNISRLIHARFLCASRKGKTECGQSPALTHELFACLVIAALRNAIKNDESYEKADKFRLNPDHVWQSSLFLSGACPDPSVKKLNQVEAECLQLLEHPANPPLAPEFFDRYLAVGQWPENQELYRELGSYLMGLAIFASGSNNPLRGIPNSQLAAAALVLAIKVINTDKNNTCYEFWPERLGAYTSYTIDSLKPVIRGLAALLRNKPKCSSILEKYYPKWSCFDWN